MWDPNIGDIRGHGTRCHGYGFQGHAFTVTEPVVYQMLGSVSQLTVR